MSTQPIEVIIDGRLVGGHPMEQRVQYDNNNQPKTQADGTPRTEAYIGIAIPKGAETDWKQTAWGQQFAAKAIADWPTGEHASPAFSYKVIDGDSQVPNTKGKKPAEREGYPGHWVINASTGLIIKCFHVGKYDPIDQIQDALQIKCGDYCRVLLTVRGNGPCQSPGIFVNPTKFELSRPGVPIIVETGMSAAEAFGGGTPPAQQPAAMAPPPAQQPGAAAAAPPPAPAPEFLQPPADYNVHANGQVYAASALKTAGWTDEQIAACPRA